jgi:hypothetical protein
LTINDSENTQNFSRNEPDVLLNNEYWKNNDNNSENTLYNNQSINNTTSTYKITNYSEMNDTVSTELSKKFTNIQNDSTLTKSDSIQQFVGSYSSVSLNMNNLFNRVSSTDHYCPSKQNFIFE